ncbi:MAG: hypothetical protein ACLSVD_13035 [Eggerthellaceae bacterium]
MDDAVAAQRDHRRAAFGALGDLGGVPRPRRASEHDRVLPSWARSNLTARCAAAALLPF